MIRALLPVLAVVRCPPASPTFLGLPSLEGEVRELLADRPPFQIADMLSGAPPGYPGTWPPPAFQPNFPGPSGFGAPGAPPGGPPGAPPGGAPGFNPPPRR